MNIIEIITYYYWEYFGILIAIFLYLFLTLKLSFIQLRGFFHTIYLVFIKKIERKEKEISYFQALCTALSGTVGLGNIAGVAIAISLGGPGALFWMWVVSILGMAAKYSECMLSSHFRVFDKCKKEYFSGPMYYISQGLPKKYTPLALVYALTLIFGCLTTSAMFPPHQISQIFYDVFLCPKILTGSILAVIVLLVVIGGIKRIAEILSYFTPSMIALYLIMGIYLFISNYDSVPTVLSLILSDAFTGDAVLGGAVFQVVVVGVRRALYSNTAGAGDTSIAYANTKSEHCAKDGLVASLGPIIDSMVSTATAMAIILYGGYGLGKFEAYHYLNTNLIEKDYDLQKLKDTLNDTTNYGHRGWYVKTFKESVTFIKIHDASDSRHLITPYINFYDVDELAKSIGFVVYNAPKNLKASLFFQDEEFENTLNDYEANYSESWFELTLNKQGEWTWGHFQLTSSFIQWLKKHKEIKGAQIKFNWTNPESTQTESLWFLNSTGEFRKIKGIELSAYAYQHFLGAWFKYLLPFFALGFGLSSMISFCYYGMAASVYLFGKIAILPFVLIFCIISAFAPILNLEIIVSLGDFAYGILLFINAIALLLLSGKILQLTNEYWSSLKK